MTDGRDAEPDWFGLYTSWEAQQESFNRNREARFRMMVSVVRAAVGERPRLLDVGCGPGPLSRRLLTALPGARMVAVDVDPVVQRIGREVHGNAGGRLAWVRADLARPGWARALPAGRFDGAVSTTALHWLGRRELGRFYAELAGRLRPGAVFVNGDYLPWGRPKARLGRLAEAIRRRDLARASRAARWAPWRDWWRTVERIPALAPELAERRRRFASSHPETEHVSVDDHVRALARAGFTDVDVVWQYLEDRVLFARRGPARGRPSR